MIFPVPLWAPLRRLCRSRARSASAATAFSAARPGEPCGKAGPCAPRAARPHRALDQLLLAALLLAGPRLSAANIATSAPVGYVNITLLSNSDTVVAVPLAPALAFTGRFETITGGFGPQFVAQVSGAPGFAADQFKDFYYVRITSGARRGMYFTIIANSADTLTLDSAGYEFSSITPGDTFCIRKYWTLATLFPPDEGETATNPLTASASTLAPLRRSQIILPDNNYPGINLPATGVYYFTEDMWRQSIAGNPNADHVILYPDTYFVIRQPASVAGDVTWSVIGDVATETQRVPLSTRITGPQDNAVALNRPLDIRLADSGLETGFIASASTLAPFRRDQLLVFDNSVRAINKSAAAVYYRIDGNWVQAVAGNPSANDVMLDATSGIVIRKYQTTNGAPAEWLNTENL